ncbi:MAG: hypothetical protein COS14_11690, partial [Bacteroidetes bacterium CG02_land_8_20_14_3_00_31_25]
YLVLFYPRPEGRGYSYCTILSLSQYKLNRTVKNFWLNQYGYGEQTDTYYLSVTIQYASLCKKQYLREI